MRGPQNQIEKGNGTKLDAMKEVMQRQFNIVLGEDKSSKLNLNVANLSIEN